MKWNSVPPDYAVKAIAAKELARNNRSRQNLYVLFGLLTGITAGIGIAIFLPGFLEEERNWIVPLLAASGISIGFILQAFNPSVALPSCPNCSYDWTIREGKSVPISQQMLTWDRCPGCGAIMNDELLQIAVKKRVRAN
jgi:hypothetical protein